jgi:hypothetical protein
MRHFFEIFVKIFKKFSVKRLDAHIIETKPVMVNWLDVKSQSKSTQREIVGNEKQMDYGIWCSFVFCLYSGWL